MIDKSLVFEPISGIKQIECLEMCGKSLTPAGDNPNQMVSLINTVLQATQNIHQST